MTDYFRPLAQTGPVRPGDALALAGGWAWCTHVEHLRRGHLPAVVPAADIPAEVALALWTPRAPLLGMALDRPRLMGIVNVTPDSFSDGGQFHDRDAAVTHAMAMAGQGADILDIGGESTRPGSDTVETQDEISRVVPVIAALSAAGAPPVSIDTRKAAVARAALDAGAALVNDVAAFSHDPALAPLAAERRVPVCLMHAKGDPKTMQDDPHYDDVLLDVYDFLAERVAMAEAAGIARAQIIVDPGIGFGKTIAHNLTLLRGLSLFHGLGCPILLGASRKRFIGTLGDAPDPADRAPGSIAVALAAVQQGVQICRVHDMKQTKQAVRLFAAAMHIGTAE